MIFGYIKFVMEIVSTEKNEGLRKRESGFIKLERGRREAVPSVREHNKSRARSYIGSQNYIARGKDRSRGRKLI